MLPRIHFVLNKSTSSAFRPFVTKSQNVQKRLYSVKPQENETSKLNERIRKLELQVADLSNEIQAFKQIQSQRAQEGQASRKKVMGYLFAFFGLSNILLVAGTWYLKKEQEAQEQKKKAQQ